jgi:hypothetical protein
MATLLAAASVELGVEAEGRERVENRGASGDCHPRLVREVGLFFAIIGKICGCPLSLSF